MMTARSVSQPVWPVTLEIRTVIFTVYEDHLNVLLRTEAREPAEAAWEIPGTPLIAARTLEATATQLQSTLTGVRDAYLEQLYTYGPASEDEFAGSISIVYFALIPADAIAENSGPEGSTVWFPVDGLPPLAHIDADMVAYALRRLRYKLEYTAVGFELLPETFTLSELQQTYEIILGEKLDKRNFRRRILEAGIIESTPHRRGGEGRPAQLYRYRPDAVAEVKARRLFP